MPKLSTQQESLKFNPTTLLSLFELDGTNVGLSTIYRFHDGTNNNYSPITLNGLQYTGFPVKVEGLDYDGKGTLPRGTLTISNINGFVSSLLLQNQQLNRAKFSRIRVFARFIDAVNFDGNINPWGTPDPTAAYESDIFFINRKIAENRDIVQFELVTSLELEAVKLPNRPILANVCPFRFRDPKTCGYAGAPISDRANRTFVGYYGMTLVDQGQYNPLTTYNQGDYVYVLNTSTQLTDDKLFYVANSNGIVGSINSPINKPDLWLFDMCSKSMNGCRLHFPSPNSLPFGGFPGVTRGNLIPTS